MSTPDSLADARVDGNTRLTAMTGAILFVLLAGEGLTILAIGNHVDWHVAIGAALVPFLVVKMASTLWRFARYYTGSPAYVRRGAPALVLRLLGPLMHLLTIALFVTGFIALFLHNLNQELSMAHWHKLIFFPWFGVTAVHVLGHLLETLQHGREDFVPRTRRAAPGSWLRQGVLLVSLVVAVAFAEWIFPKGAHWPLHLLF